MPDCPRCGVAYLDGESHHCVQNDRRGLTLVVVCAGLLWIVLSAAGAPVVTTVNYLFLLIVGLGKMLLARLLG
jgi:hypothetical protein